LEEVERRLEMAVVCIKLKTRTGRAIIRPQNIETIEPYWPGRNVKDPDKSPYKALCRVIMATGTQHDTTINFRKFYKGDAALGELIDVTAQP